MAEQTGLKALSIGNDALAILMRYGWPGNVRQLAGVLFRAALQCEEARSLRRTSRISPSSRVTPAGAPISRRRSASRAAMKRSPALPGSHSIPGRPSAPARGDRSGHHPPRHRPLPRPDDRGCPAARDRPVDSLSQARRARDRHRRLKARRKRLVSHSAPNRGPAGFEDVVDADDLRSLVGCFDRESDASANPAVRRRFVRKRTDGSLAARPHHERAAQRMESARPLISSRLCPTFLPKPNPGSIRMCSRRCRFDSRRDPVLEPQIDFDQHIVVARVILHHLGRASMVHQHDRNIEGGRDLRDRAS